MRIKIFIIFLLCGILISCFGETTSEEQEVKKAEQTVDWVTIEKTVKDFLEVGFVKKIDIEARKAWVDMNMWHLANAEQKEMFTRTLAFYCGHETNSSTYFIDVFDWSSGRKIAKYDALGFKVY